MLHTLNNPLTTIRVGCDEWDRHYSAEARARTAATMQRIQEVKAWARARPWSSMRGTFWGAFRRRLEAAGSLMPEHYLDELRWERDEMLK